MFGKLEEVTKDWHWYDKKLFQLYLYSGKSFRTLSKETKISVNSIFHTIKDCREKVRKELWEDYLDFINEDYERL